MFGDQINKLLIVEYIDAWKLWEICIKFGVDKAEVD